MNICTGMLTMSQKRTITILLRQLEGFPLEQVENAKIALLYRRKCVRCRKPYNHIHEIIPKSRNVNWREVSNRIPLCLECHTWAHVIGTKNSAPILENLQLQRLEEYYAHE